ncbi:hypothetical protein [Glycomyces sp. NPDC047010]
MASGIDIWPPYWQTACSGPIQVAYSGSRTRMRGWKPSARVAT